MKIQLPKLGKEAIAFPHFPTKHQAFLFRAWEYLPVKKIASILQTTEDNVRRAAAEMGLPATEANAKWLKNGYITVIRALWHILPYGQLLDALELDEETFAVILREEDFLDFKLQNKPICETVTWRELTEEEAQQTAEIRRIMRGIDLGGVAPFDFRYEVPDLQFSGNEVFQTRMIYLFSGLYQNAFDVESEEYCSDEMLDAYRKLGINAVWTQGVLFRLTEFPFAPELSHGWQERLARMKRFADRLSRFGIRLFLYINEPRPVSADFASKWGSICGHRAEDDKICLCTATPEVKEYLMGAMETICRTVPNIGGFFTITRSENHTHCHSHTDLPGAIPCNCPRCSARSVEDTVAEVISCLRQGIDRADPDIKLFAWSWAWYEYTEEIVKRLPKRVILLTQSERNMPFEIGGVRGDVKDYSMSIIGPSETAKQEWAWAKQRGLEIGAKVQVNTTWEASTVPALPVYPSIEAHMEALKKEGTSHLMLSWTLGGYPSYSLAHAAKYFYERCEFPKESDAIRRASEQFTEAFREFPFHIETLYYGPQNAGPSSLLYATPTGYEATMTCYAYDDLDTWRSIYPADVFETQFSKLCERWKQGLDLLKDEPPSQTVRMAKAAYALFCSSLDQVRFYRARERGDRKTMAECAARECRTARDLLALMNEDASIGFEAANHYYFSKGQLAEKILNCTDLIRKLDRA